jgi:hypothetical protein
MDYYNLAISHQEVDHFQSDGHQAVILLKKLAGDT